VIATGNEIHQKICAASELRCCRTPTLRRIELQGVVIVDQLGHEANLAWALALAAKSHLNADERNGIFVTIGAGETYAAIRYLLRTVALKRIPVGTDVVLGCKSWLNAYVGHKDERYLRRLIDTIVGPRTTTTKVWVYRSPTASSASSKPDREPEW
jgi:hypothetical protein